MIFKVARLSTECSNLCVAKNISLPTTRPITCGQAAGTALGQVAKSPLPTLGTSTRIKTPPAGEQGTEASTRLCLRAQCQVHLGEHQHQVQIEGTVHSHSSEIKPLHRPQHHMVTCVSQNRPKFQPHQLHPWSGHGEHLSSSCDCIGPCSYETLLQPNLAPTWVAKSLSTICQPQAGKQIGQRL